jgi:hypothetical protein
MSASENKQLMQHIFAELAQGNSRPLDTELVSSVLRDVVLLTDSAV